MLPCLLACVSEGVSVRGKERERENDESAMEGERKSRCIRLVKRQRIKREQLLRINRSQRIERKEGRRE